jgi:hypothetical protein
VKSKSYCSTFLLALFLCTSQTIIAQSNSAAIATTGAPEVGRSLFDFMVSHQTEEGAIYDVPFPFEELVNHLVARHNGVSRGEARDLPRPQVVLIPNGRSLQKEEADLETPRVVVGFSQHPKRSREIGLSLKDKLFLGFVEKTKQIEVISYNERMGRFEFQIVADYSESGERKVLYVDRNVCIKCHKAETPIFSKNPWDETNANRGVYTALRKSNDELERYLDFITVTGNKGIPYDLDNGTDRAARLPVLQKFWWQGCRSVNISGYGPRDCRATMLLMSWARSKAIFLDDLDREVNGYRFLTYQQMLSIFQQNMSMQDLAFNLGDIPNRNPSGYIESQIQTIEQERDRISQWIENIRQNRTQVPEIVLPESQPLVPYTYWGQGQARFAEAFDLLVSGLSTMLTPSERRAIPEENLWNEVVLPGFAKVIGQGGRALFGEGPYLKGNTMAALFAAMDIDSVGGTTPTNSCCAKTNRLPPVNSGGSGGGGEDGEEDGGIALLNRYCAEACHATFSGSLGFLKRNGQTDRQLWQQIIRKERDQICFRLNWTLPESELSARRRMPLGPARREFADGESRNEPPFPRQLIIEAYGAKLLEFAGSPDDIAALNQANGGSPFSSASLQEYASKCHFQRLSSQN